MILLPNMSEIKPFRALVPNPEWFENLLNPQAPAVGLEALTGLKMLLEPGDDSLLDNLDLCRYHLHLNDLQQERKYTLTDRPGIYIYERESDFGSQTGIWTLTNLRDLTTGKIIIHEHTLTTHETRIKNYRQHVGIEGSPVLLTYPRESSLSNLIEKKVLHSPDLNIFHKDSRHKIWAVYDTETIDQFQKIFADIPSVYVADGHHRLAAAASMQNLAPQWITTLYVTTGQLRCREFHKIVIPERPVSKELLCNSIAEFFDIERTDGNMPVKPNCKGTFGLRHDGLWYKLILKEQYDQGRMIPDVSFLQAEVLERMFGISDPKVDLRLSSWHPEQWDEMISSSDAEPHSVLFTLHPMTASELIQQAEMKAALPPKSTYIEPKVPFGLLLFSHKILQNSQKGVVCNA